MKLNVNPYMWRGLSLLLFSFILSISGCGGSSYTATRLDIAESIMESRPDSALAILSLLNINDLKEKSEKARYALLKSIALDKNCVDVMTFDVIKPAVDYYVENGTSDERLKTYYYHGRIYQNRNEKDKALGLFIKGLDVSNQCKDSMAIVRVLVAQGIIYKEFYDLNGYCDSYLKAAKILQECNMKSLEFDCLLNALNASIMLGAKESADSILTLIRNLKPSNSAQDERLYTHELAYALQFESNNQLLSLVKDADDHLRNDINGLLNLALAYNKLAQNLEALKRLNYIDGLKVNYDTLKYSSIKYKVHEDLYDYQKALEVYKDFVNRLETINSSKIEQKRQSMEEKYRMELQAEKEARKHAMVVWGFIGGISVLIMVIIIMVLIIRSNRIKKNLALEQARTAELENQNLKNEKENLALANKNLKLEHDKKVLEAENLAHRVTELESESENLKELLESQKEMPEEVRKAIKTRIEMLNTYLASQISDHKEFEKAYDTWVADHTANIEEFMNSNRLAFQVSHPNFIKYFEDHDLTASELNYVCLYAIGLRGKDVGNYMKKRSHVNISSAIRKKLGIDKHETNIGIYVRKLLQSL